MTAYEVIAELTRKGIKLHVKDFNLKVKANKGTLTPDLQKLIKENKEELVRLVEGMNKKPDLTQVKKKDYYVLSSSQKRLYFIHHYDSLSTAYNISQAVKLGANVEIENIKKAFNSLIYRHEPLRTHFSMINEEAVQIISENIDFNLEYYETESDKLKAVFESFVRPFDLGQAPLIRAGLVKNIVDSEHKYCEYFLMVDLHHIITDGLSQNVLIDDFISLYNGESLPAIELQYKDYAEWQQGRLLQSNIGLQRQFWLELFSELPTALELPVDYDRPKTRSMNGSQLKFYLNTSLSKGLEDLALKRGSTKYMVILSVFNILLSKVSGSKDIVVGTPSAGRQHADLENMVGMFVNTIVLRNRLNGESTFYDFLKSVTTKTISCFDNQEYQYEELINELDIARETNRNPLFDVMFSYQNFIATSQDPDSSEFESTGLRSQVSKFDLTLSVTETGDELWFNFDYSTELFRESTIKRFKEYFIRIVNQILLDPQIIITEIDILSHQEKQQLLYDFNNTKIEWEEELTLTSLLNKQVHECPKNIAVLHGDVELTYKELDQRSNKVANFLKNKGVGLGSVVGLMMDRSIDQIVGLVGIMKADAAYLPIDKTLPASRVRAILNEGKIGFLLTDEDTNGLLKERIKLINIRKHKVELQSCRSLESAIKPSDIAYVMFTSGSTGKPKGVEIEHRSIVNLVLSQRNTLSINSGERILQFSSIGFDASAQQIWLALTTGCTLVLIDKEIIVDNQKFSEYLIDHRVTHLHATPSFLEQLDLPNESSLIRIIAGGEECTYSLASKYCNQYEFYNEYGPTEATVASTITKVTSADLSKNRISIGRPINNTFVDILDNEQKLIPRGALGELCITGMGL
ncbi:condensation domain-containing protein, partial [Fulvivirga kasyanovii]